MNADLCLGGAEPGSPDNTFLSILENAQGSESIITDAFDYWVGVSQTMMIQVNFTIQYQTY